MSFCDSAQVVVELYVPCSESKDDGLFFPLESVYGVFQIRLAHVTVHCSVRITMNIDGFLTI